MASTGVSVTIGAALADPERVNLSANGMADAVTNLAAAQGAHKTAFETALAQLVTDGASPTQAHVNTANSAYTTLKADIASVSLPGDVILIYNPTNVVSQTKLRQAVTALLSLVAGNGTLTL